MKMSMLSRRLPRVFGAIAALAVGSMAYAQPAVGQIDDFQDGTTENWLNGVGTFSSASGGQAGPTDLFMRLISNGGGGPGSKLAVYNDNQWAGDYITPGITSITMDLANFGQTDLDMRLLLLFGAGGDWTSTVPNVVPADGIWRWYTFGVTAADLTQVGGAGTLNDTLNFVGRMMIRHQSGAPAGIGGATSVVAELGVDNIIADGGAAPCEEANIDSTSPGSENAIDFSDLSIVLGNWTGDGIPAPGCPPANPVGDFDGDCDVDFADLSLLLGFWGPCP